MPQRDEAPLPKLRDFTEPNHLRIDNMFYSGGYAAIMGATAVSIYGALCKHYDPRTKKTRLSSPKIMELTGLSNNQVYTILKQLKYYRIIDYTPQRGRTKCNEYIFLHCSTWKPIDKCEHASHFKKRKTTTMLHKKHERSSHYKPIKCEPDVQENVNVVHTIKRSSLIKESGGSGSSDLVVYKGKSDFQKIAVPENGNSQSKNVLTTTTTFSKKLSPEEEEKRKNLLHQQSQQIIQEESNATN